MLLRNTWTKKKAAHCVFGALRPYKMHTA